MRVASRWLLVVLVASLASHGSPQEREKCMINFLEGCRLHPWYAGRGELADDSLPAYNHLGVGASEERCLARPQEYFEWCGNTFDRQIMATYVPTGKVKFPACCMLCAADVMRLRLGRLLRALSQASIFPSDSVVNPTDNGTRISECETSCRQDSEVSQEQASRDMDPTLDADEALAAVAGRTFTATDVVSLPRQRAPLWTKDPEAAVDDVLTWSAEVLETFELLNRHGGLDRAFDAMWSADAATVPPLGVEVFILNHLSDGRRRWTQKMARAAGFRSLHLLPSTSGDTIDLAALEAQGLVSADWNHHSRPDVRTQKRYVAHALDAVAALRAAQVRAAVTGQWMGVFEDDITLTVAPSKAARRVRAALQQLPADADALYLEWCWDECEEARFDAGSPDISRPHEAFCAAAILYSPQGLQRVVQAAVPVYSVMDDMISGACASGKLNCYKLRRPVYVQDLIWGSRLDKEKGSTPFHSVFRLFSGGGGAGLCRHKPGQVRPVQSLWWQALENGYIGPQVRHPEEAAPVTIAFVGCECAGKGEAGRVGFSLSLGGLVPGVEYWVSYVGTLPGGGQSGHHIGLVAVSPAQGGILDVSFSVGAAFVAGVAGQGGLATRIHGDHLIQASNFQVHVGDAYRGNYDEVLGIWKMQRKSSACALSCLSFAG